MHPIQTIRSKTPTKRHALLFTGAVVSATVALSACIGSHFTTYKSFKSALDKGASCAELFDQREHFHDEGTLAKVDRDLAQIGCTSRDAVRAD
jgi:hypothetical protein